MPDPTGNTQPVARADTEQSDCCYRLRATKAVLADREAELLRLKGPCGSRQHGVTIGCRLHYAHSGPCDIIEEASTR